MIPRTLRAPRARKLAFLSAALLAGCQSLFLHPDRLERRSPLADGVTREDLWIHSGDGTRLHGWLLRPADAPRSTIVFLHGNAENITSHVAGVLWLVQAGHQVLAIDYRGFGRSEGEATLQGVQEDAAAALDAAFDRADIDPDRVLVLGQSLGGALAVYAVAHSPHRERVRLLVIDSAFAGYRRILRDKLASFVLTWPFGYPVASLLADDLSPERWIDGLGPVPVLILHGGIDPIVPVGHARLLYEKAREPKGLWIVQDVGHIQAFSNKELRSRFLEILDEYVVAGPAP